MKYLLALILATCTVNPALRDAIDVSVTVVSEDDNMKGSGLLVTRTVCDDEVSFVWTAGHVVGGSRISETEFAEFKIIQEYDNEQGKVEHRAKVIRYDEKMDLALLRVIRPNSFDVSTRFHDDSQLPVGEPVWHVGSFGGEVLPHSVVDGVISRMFRQLENDTWTQVSTTAQPGSSGGGVFLKSDGSCIGLVIRAKPSITLIHPVSRMRAWAKTNDVEWAINPDAEMPTDESLLNLPIEQQCPAEVEELLRLFFGGMPTPAP